MELTQEQIERLSTYEGWVAWASEVPIFEARAWQPALASLTDPTASGERQYRAEDRKTLEWDDVPHERVTQLELYFARDEFAQQPVVRLSRMHDQELRWVQMKMRGLQVEAAAVDPRGEGVGGAVERTPLQGYRVGYFAPDRLGMPEGAGWRHAPLMYYEVTRGGGLRRKAYNCHPCWPRPHGLGWSPEVLGLTRGDVPPHPGQETKGGDVVTPGDGG